MPSRTNNKYIDSQNKVKHIIEKQIQDTTKVKVNQIIKEGDQNHFGILESSRSVTIRTKDEEGRKMIHTEETKEHIAKYFENQGNLKKAKSNGRSS